MHKNFLTVVLEYWLSRSSSSEVRVRVPFFSVVYLRGTQNPKKRKGREGQYVLNGIGNCKPMVLRTNVGKTEKLKPASSACHWQLFGHLFGEPRERDMCVRVCLQGKGRQPMGWYPILFFKLPGIGGLDWSRLGCPPTNPTTKRRAEF